MKNLAKVLILSAAVVMTGAAQAQETKTLDQLLETVKQNRVSEARVNKQREAEFLNDRNDKRAMLSKAKKELANEKDRGERLAKQFAANEETLTKKTEELEQATGTLGEMFGVVRQSASEAYGRIHTSIISAEFPGRGEFLARMSEESKGLPNIRELEDLWFALLTEMTESGKVSRFNAEVVSLDGGVAEQEIVRVGTFNLIGENGYLVFDESAQQVQPLGRQPDGHMVSAAQDLLGETAGVHAFYADPSRGAILGLLKQKATLSERYHAGGVVGYIITVMLLIGLGLGVFKIIQLYGVGNAIKAQLKNTNAPSDKNPLGRILAVYQNNKHADVENLELKLDEAILGELPRIESGINLIKIFSAIAPLLGLLGTVLGMIATFQQITLFGTGDPRIMAGSISMALVTTAQGIIAALPLILMHSVVASRSKSIVHVLDEQTAGIIAAHAEKEQA